MNGTAMTRSRVGSYAGYSDPVANGYVRTSQYVTVRDGCQIAVDMLHPAANGLALGGRRPAVVRGTGYRRAFRRGERIAYDVSRIPFIERFPIGHVITPYELAPVAERLVNHGYVFVSVDLRGTGASFGSYDQPATLQTGRDLADVIDWIAGQDWSDGKIGMWGRSWEASAQIVTAMAGTPNLTCLFPMGIGAQTESTWFNGLFAHGFRWPYDDLRKRMELDELAMAVDGPNGEALRAEALANRPGYFPFADVDALGAVHAEGAYAENWLKRANAIDSPVDAALGRPRLPAEDAEAINACGAPIYWVEGWWDLNFINSAIGLYNQLRVPKKLTIGPWTHSQFAMPHEPHRWFDHWLRGIENGVMDEPEVHYAVASTDGSALWRDAASMPPAGVEHPRFFLGLPDGADPLRDGALAATAQPARSVPYVVDYDATTGPQTRTTYLWNSTKMDYGDMSRRLGQCLSFTTPPLQEPLELTGAPTLILAVTASAAKAAVFATLEDVEPGGASRYLTEGVLNLEYRREMPRPPGQFGTTSHPVFTTDKEPVTPGERMQIRLDMLALACAIPAGHRLRLTLAGADRDNYYIPAQSPPVALTFELGACALTLPVATRRNAMAEGLFEDDPMPFGFEHRDI